MSKFKEGDRVLLSTESRSDRVVTNVGASKLAPQFIGPSKEDRRRLYAGNYLIVVTALNVLRRATETLSSSYTPWAGSYAK